VYGPLPPASSSQLADVLFFVSDLCSAVLTLIALVPSIFVRVKWARIFSLVITIIGAILSTVVFGIDVAIVTAAKTGVEEYLGGNTNISILYGREIWMSLAAVILLWTAVVSHSVVSCYCCGRVRWNDQEGHHHQEK
jgi:hypothetical protein